MANLSELEAITIMSPNYGFLWSKRPTLRSIIAIIASSRPAFLESTIYEI